MSAIIQHVFIKNHHDTMIMVLKILQLLVFPSLSFYNNPQIVLIVNKKFQNNIIQCTELIHMLDY